MAGRAELGLVEAGHFRSSRVGLGLSARAGGRAQARSEVSEPGEGQFGAIQRGLVRRAKRLDRGGAMPIGPE